MPDLKEKRQYKRFHVPGTTVSYHLHGYLQSPSEEDCPVLNFGKGGIGFQTNNWLKPGRKLTVILASKEEALIRQIELQTQVIYCTLHFGTPYRYHVGVAFAPFAVSNGCNPPEALKVLDQLEKEYAIEFVKR